jgi:hypothetical protein
VIWFRTDGSCRADVRNDLHDADEVAQKQSVPQVAAQTDNTHDCKVRKFRNTRCEFWRRLLRLPVEFGAISRAAATGASAGIRRGQRALKQ